MRATVMFNGSLYEGEVLRTTGARMLVRFTTGTGITRGGGHVLSNATSPEALFIGRTLARQLFAARGNHSEVHLSEAELAALLAVAAETAAWKARIDPGGTHE